MINKRIKDALLIKEKEKADIDQLDVTMSKLVRKSGDIKFIISYAAAVRIELAINIGRVIITIKDFIPNGFPDKRENNSLGKNFNVMIIDG
ncbi:27380_t:CDS:2, partial [Dentiscutata erythropus]